MRRNDDETREPTIRKVLSCAQPLMSPQQPTNQPNQLIVNCESWSRRSDEQRCQGIPPHVRAEREQSMWAVCCVSATDRQPPSHITPLSDLSRLSLGSAPWAHSIRSSAHAAAIGHVHQAEKGEGVMKCVQDCRTSLWGGTGIPDYNDNGDCRCGCEVEWSTYNILGVPSCVPSKAHAVFGAVGLLIAMVILFQSAHQLNRQVRKKINRGEV